MRGIKEKSIVSKDILKLNVYVNLISKMNYYFDNSFGRKEDFTIINEIGSCLEVEISRKEFIYSILKNYYLELDLCWQDKEIGENLKYLEFELKGKQYKIQFVKGFTNIDLTNNYSIYRNELYYTTKESVDLVFEFFGKIHLYVNLENIIDNSFAQNPDGFEKYYYSIRQINEKIYNHIKTNTTFV